MKGVEGKVEEILRKGGGQGGGGERGRKDKDLGKANFRGKVRKRFRHNL